MTQLSGCSKRLLSSGCLFVYIQALRDRRFEPVAQ